MKKIIKLLFIILFVSFILPNMVFASWWNPLSWFKKTNTNITIKKELSSKVTIKKCNREPNKFEECQIKYWQGFKNIDECNNIEETDPVYKRKDDYLNESDICRMIIAKKQDNISFCEKITNINMKNDCIGILDKTKNKNICDYKENRDDCLYSLATQTRDLSYCDLMQKRGDVSKYI